MSGQPAPAGALPGPTPSGAGGPAAGPAPLAGPAARLPRPPGPFDLAVREFWAAGRLPARTGVLAWAAVAGFAGGALVGHRLGLGAAVVGVLLWAPALPALVRRKVWGDLGTVAVSIALLAMAAVLDAGWVVSLCVVVSAIAAAAASTSARSAPAVVLSGIGAGAGGVRAVAWLVKAAADRLGARRGGVLTGLRSVAVTVVLLVVFGALFSSADRIFASYVPRLNVDLLPGQVVVGLIVGLVTATFAHLALEPPGWSDLRLPRARAARRAEWLLPVVALDAMVLSFVLVQVGALVGGHDYVQRTAGVTYAEYARAGFAQLVAATALTLVVVGVAARRAPRTSDVDRLISRAALGVLCVATLGVVASALRRMDLYVEAFGLTRLRLLVVVGEITLGVLLVLVLVAGIRWRAGWLPRAVVQVVAVAMLGLAVLNPDALIVRHNATAELQSGLDVGYLDGLSADAVPAVDELPEPLRTCLLRRIEVPPPDGLVSWNLGRQRAQQVRADGAGLLLDATCSGS